ncbi:ankyrin repeat-containing domain protein [Mucor mucedo]|uniref:ankyrin repeat-containing domain protein n=1 Tax=Mucor mucedo TaxID=29922 RepID=UPI0022200CAB|nr:ankyrin repeat-containing domain protein [Mucor mucedo]KAI7897020.1 ankyrin repeat-containing domain protein [Mucor mucedo]
MTHDKKPRGRTSCQDPNKTDKAGRTKIFSSTSSGSLQKVKELIERGADVNHRDNAGWAPLHEAALKGQYAIAQHLIQCGAIVNVRGFEDDTPLHDACSYGYADCVKLLVDSGADVYALNTDKKRPIDLCEDKTCISLVKAKMKELDRLASRDTQGKTSLHRACIDGNLTKVQHLLMTGANTNATDTLEWTPLHCAARYGHLEITKLLIDHGADINSLGQGASTVLHIACQYGHEAIVQYLVQMGADVHATDAQDQTPYAVSHSVTVRQIITAHIDEERRLRATTEAIDEITFVSNTKQKRKNNNEDALLSREERKIQAIMKAFEKAEKKQQAKRERQEETIVNNNNNHNHTHNNIKKRKSSSKRDCSSEPPPPPPTTTTTPITPKKPMVVDTSKFDPYKKDTSGRTHLHRWSIRGNVQAVETLLKAGANPCERDHAGYTPLHEAALRGKTDVVRLLLESNANVNCQGADFDTPLHDATENGYPDVVLLLLEYGADVNAKNSKGLTPLEIAIDQDNKEIEALLKQYKDIKPKKRKLVLAADMPPCKQPESPTSPIGNHSGGVFGDMKTAKAHARQLSGQHLPKKSLKAHLVKTEVTLATTPTTTVDEGPHTPIPTPPPERWQQKVVLKEEDLYPSIHCASRYLPLYTIQLCDHFFVVDLQVSLLLGISTQDLMSQYPHLDRRPVQSKEKERLWSPLSTMLTQDQSRQGEKQKFLETDIYFVRLDQVISVIKDDYSHLSKSIITITLDIGYTSPPPVKLPPKFAMKMRKCGMLKFDQKT